MSSKSSIKNLLHLSIPIFFANLAIPLVAIVDTGLMGNLDDASYLTATSIASSLFSMIFLKRMMAQELFLLKRTMNRGRQGIG